MLIPDITDNLKLFFKIQAWRATRSLYLTDVCRASAQMPMSFSVYKDAMYDVKYYCVKIFINNYKLKHFRFKLLILLSRMNTLLCQH